MEIEEGLWRVKTFRSKILGWILSSITVDFSDPPNDKERAKLRKRRSRLRGQAESVIDATTAMRKIAAPSGIARVNVRYEFVDTGVPVSVQRRGDPSDRRLPAKEDRPPATQIMSPNGAALRFFLATLFEAQARTRPGNRLPLAAGGSTTSWTDLIASGAEPSDTQNYHMSVSAKKIRQLGTALDRLAEAKLVELTGKKDGPGTGKYEKFRLMHEGGRRETGPNIPYQVPDPQRERAFPVPVTLFTNGWIHVLEDTELAFLLMVASGHHTMAGQAFRITAADRLLRFGIGRDAYSAYKILSGLGLVIVTQDPGRHLDGKVKDYGSGGKALPHTLGFVPAGFDRDALTTLSAQIDYQLDRLNADTGRTVRRAASAWSTP